MYFTGLEVGILFVAGASAAALRSPIEVRNGNNLNLQLSLAAMEISNESWAHHPAEHTLQACPSGTS
jgi:hypothetical protein